MNIDDFEDEIREKINENLLLQIEEIYNYFNENSNDGDAVELTKLYFKEDRKIREFDETLNRKIKLGN